MQLGQFFQSPGFRCRVFRLQYPPDFGIGGLTVNQPTAFQVRYRFVQYLALGDLRLGVVVRVNIELAGLYPVKLG